MTEPHSDRGSHSIDCPICGAEIIYWTTDPTPPEVIHDPGHGSHVLQWGAYREAVFQ